MDLESIYLNLKKNIHNITYFNFAKNQDEEIGNYKLKEINVKQEDLVANTFLFFEEKEIILNDLKNLCLYLYYKNKLIEKEEYSKFEKEINEFPFNDIVNRINYTLIKYLEQPGLLDNIIEDFITKIMGFLKVYIHDCYTHNKNFKINSEINRFLNILYTLQNVRGSENVKKYFPHEAKDLCPLILTIYFNKENDEITWEGKYILILWLSILLLMPFDFEKLDSENLNIILNNDPIIDMSNINSRIMKSILNLLIPNLMSSNKTVEITGKALSSFLSRPDVKKLNIYKIFIDYCLDKFINITDEIKDIFIISNLYKTLEYLCKKLNSEDLLVYTNKFFDLILEKEENNEVKKLINNNSYVKKNKTKFIGNFMIKQLGNIKNYWYYFKEKNNLESNLNLNKEDDNNELITNIEVYEKEFWKKKNKIKENEIQISEEIMERIEDLIEYLNKKLLDKENKIRWSTAKIFARITSRLDKQLAYEIINYVLDISDNKTEQSYHGVCLTIGEFIKRGLIQPEFLNKISKILFESLNFEHLGLGGGLVRDSACYVIWTIARIYDKTIIEKYFPKIDLHILKTALFDKEGNCRKAAAACFQEHVGRVKGYKNGIEIISETDFLSVGSLINSFLKVAYFVCHFDQYTDEFINYLGKEKIFHEDKNIRKIASFSLSLLITLKPEKCIDIVNYIFEKINTKIFNKKHGILIGLSEVLIGVSGNSYENLLEKNLYKNSIFLKTLRTNEKKLMLGGEHMEKFEKEYENVKYINNSHLINQELKEKILGIPSLVISKNYLKGKGIDTISESLHRLIYSITLCFDDIDIKTYHSYFDILMEGLKNKLEEYQSVAIKSMKKFLLKFVDKDIEFEKNQLKNVIYKLKNDSNVFIRRGYIQILPYFSNKLKNELIDEIFDAINSNLIISKNYKFNNPEARQFGIESLYKILKYTPNLKIDYVQKIFEKVLKGLEDYSRDNRGDIGSIIREKAVSCIYKLLKFVIKLNNKKEIFEFLNLNEIFGKIIQQLSEQIDRVRLTSGSFMQLIVDNLFDKIPEFSVKQIIYDNFNMNFLKLKFEEEKNKVYKNFDISLIDDSKFISYKNNKNFIYFWSIAHCNFSIISNLLKEKDLRYFIIKGISMSYGSLTENTQKEAQNCLIKFFEGLRNDYQSILDLQDIFIKLLNIYKRNLVFITPVIKTMNLFYKTEDLFENINDLINEKNLEILNILFRESKNSKQIQKLLSICNLINSLFLVIEFNDKDDFIKKTSPILNILLFHEFPNVSKEIVENFYVFMTLKGELFFEEDYLEKILNCLSSEYWKDSNLNKIKDEFLNLFK